MIIYNAIRNGQVSLQKEEKIQEEFWSELSETLKGNPNYNLKDQINKIKNNKKALKWIGKRS